MIIDFLVTMFLGVLTAVLGLIPAFEIWEPTDTSSLGHFYDEWAYQLGNFLTMWDLFIPVRMVITCAFIIVASKVFVALAQFILFIWEKLPFKST